MTDGLLAGMPTEFRVTCPGGATQSNLFHADYNPYRDASGFVSISSATVSLFPSSLLYRGLYSSIVLYPIKACAQENLPVGSY